MSFPAPAPGLVSRSGFLWSAEARSGAEEGSKDRPCAIVVAARLDKTDDIVVLVAAITHAPPEEDDFIPIPPPVARMLDLDGEHHWIRLDELNEFVWPGYDLIPVRFDVDTSKPLKRRAGHLRGPWLRANHGAGAQCATQLSMSHADRELV